MELSGKTRKDNPSADANEAYIFCSGISSKEYDHKIETEWLARVTEELIVRVKTMENYEVEIRKTKLRT